MTSTTDISTPFDEATLAAMRLLSDHSDLRILRRIGDTATIAVPASDNQATRIGIVIDTETNGLDVTRDAIIELAIQRFRFDARGRILEIGAPRTWRQDPGRPLPVLITQITGLTDADLAGQVIDDVAATALLLSADVVIAQNVRFDAPFIEKRLPGAAGLPWACTLHDIDWRAAGFNGRALGHLLMEAGWFFEAHRAEADIAALLHLLAHPLENGANTVLGTLIQSAEKCTVRLDAIGAGYPMKTVLRLRGYTWNADAKHWSIEIAPADAVAEQAWLKRCGSTRAATQTPITWRERHR